MDWAELNPHLLHLIVKKLGDISNFIRFRAVCRQWHLVAPAFDPPPQLPWFLGCYENPENKSYCRFYSLYSNKTQNLHLPQVQGALIPFGSSSRYVHIYDRQPHSEYHEPFMYLKLLDPLTGSKIHMPFTGSKVPIPLEEKKTLFWRKYIGPSHSCNPNSTLNDTEAVTAMLIGRHPSGILSHVILLQIDDRKETPSSLTKHILQRKIVIYEHMEKITKLLDVTTRDVVPVLSKQGLRFRYLLEACGDVLGVVTHFKSFDLDTPMDEALFELYRLEDDGRTPCWVKINGGIGDRMLFLEYCGSGFCLNASHFAGFKGNCIYFQESNGKNGSDFRKFLGRFDIEESTIQLLPVEFSGVWFVPHL